MIVALIVAALALSAFFSGSEIAFVTANRLRAEVRAREAGWPGRTVLGFLADSGTFLATTLVGNNVALVVYSTLMAVALEPPLAGALASVGLGEAPGAVLVAQTAVAAVVVLVVGEVVPKSLLRQPPVRALLALAPPLRATYWLFWPVIKLADGVSRLLVRALGTAAEEATPFVRRDFELVIRESRETGALDLDDEESEILSNVFELRALRVKDSMVPRTEVRAVDESATLDAVRAAFVATGFSRLPVFRGDVDTVVGVVLAHDLFHAPGSLAEIVRPVRVVPESKPARDLLFDFLRDGGTTLAVAVDEYGGTAGVVTLEDLLEELFGDIRDEHDPAAAPIRRIDDRTVHVHGRVELDELADAGVALPEGDYDTVAGYVLAAFGHVPDEREAFEADGLRVTVLRASPNRVEAVRIETL